MITVDGDDSMISIMEGLKKVSDKIEDVTDESMDALVDEDVIRGLGNALMHSGLKDKFIRRMKEHFRRTTGTVGTAKKYKANANRNNNQSAIQTMIANHVVESSQIDQTGVEPLFRLSQFDKEIIHGSDLQSILWIIEKGASIPKAVEHYHMARSLSRSADYKDRITQETSIRPDTSNSTGCNDVANATGHQLQSITSIWKEINQIKKGQERLRYYYLALARNHQEVTDRIRDKKGLILSQGKNVRSMATDELVERIGKSDIRDKVIDGVIRGERFGDLCKAYGLSFLEACGEELEGCVDPKRIKAREWQDFLTFHPACCPELTKTCSNRAPNPPKPLERCILDYEVDLPEQELSKRTVTREIYETLCKLDARNEGQPSDLDIVTKLFAAMTCVTNGHVNVQFLPAVCLGGDQNDDPGLEDGKDIYVLPYFYLGQWHCAIVDKKKVTLIPSKHEHSEWDLVCGYFSTCNEHLFEKGIAATASSDSTRLRGVWGRSLQYLAKLCRTSNSGAINILDSSVWYFYAACLMERTSYGQLAITVPEARRRTIQGKYTLTLQLQDRLSDKRPHYNDNDDDEDDFQPKRPRLA